MFRYLAAEAPGYKRAREVRKGACDCRCRNVAQEVRGEAAFCVGVREQVLWGCFNHQLCPFLSEETVAGGTI